MAKKNNYDNTSIKALKGADRVRKRPSVIFGSDDIEGCQHTFLEILSNAIDEAREGYGKKIHIKKYNDGSIEIQDFGRGIPVEYNEKERIYNWRLVFSELYAGAKYDTNKGGHYEYSLGLNGLGLSATQYASKFMDVIIYRDNKKYTLNFEEGHNRGGLQKESAKGHQTGTCIRWLPDDQVFTEVNIPISYITEILKRQAVVNAGVEFILSIEGKEETQSFIYKNGIADYIEEISNEANFTSIKKVEHATKGKDREDKPEYRLKFEVDFCFSRKKKLIEYYHNSSFLEYGGTPDKAVKIAFVYAIDRLIKDRGKYKKNESKINFSDIEESLILISSSFSTLTSYENQTKKAISNRFIYEAMSDFLKEQLHIYFIENSDEADKIVEQILINKRSRETAERTRINIRKKLSGNIDIKNRVEKFVDCRTKEIEKREIYIVEGDSALGACKMARDASFQAIMPVRGKILNCLKADINKIFRNSIIVDLLKVLGCGVELKSKNTKGLSTFDLNNLNWSKVIICTDADVDGFQIRTLILAMLYKLVPTIIKEGKVYIAESPLYEISSGDDTYFAYNETERLDILSEIGDKKHTVQRSKGLGENEPEMMWQTTMNPESRRLINVLLAEDESINAKESFELFLGNNLPGRKKYIKQNGSKYIDLTDIS